MLRLWIICSILCALLFSASNKVHGQTSDQAPIQTSIQPTAPPKDNPNEFMIRLNLFQQISITTGIPWNYLAAIDQYERSMTTMNKKDRPVRDGLVAIYYAEDEWAGPLNPDQNDQNPDSIAFFGGIGLDGNGDGLANRHVDEDVVYTAAKRVLDNGTSVQDFRIGLWETYKNPRSVERIMQFATIYSKFDTLELQQHAFPLPLKAVYSYRGTWGAKRGWGGRRIHEGTA